MPHGAILSLVQVMNLPRRVSAGAAALIFFAMFFALPLYAAATMCAMPCCHHATPGAKLKNNLPGCAGSECTITADDATVKAVSRYVAPAAIAIALAPTSATLLDSVVPRPDVAPEGGRRRPPLHLLNSTFRI